MQEGPFGPNDVSSTNIGTILRTDRRNSRLYRGKYAKMGQSPVFEKFAINVAVVAPGTSDFLEATFGHFLLFE